MSNSKPLTEEEKERIATNKVIKSVLKKRGKWKANVYNNSEEEEDYTIVSSPLLNSTPPTVSKALVKLYPYLIVTDKFLSVVTWTNDNIYLNFLCIIAYFCFVLYFQFLIKYFGHLLLVGIIWCYSLLDNAVEETMMSCPSLDDIVHIMVRVSTKADIVLSPLTILNSQDIQRLLFTSAFLSPLYILLTQLLLRPRSLLLVSGFYALTYHSKWSKRCRRTLWKFRIVRLFMFYVTGLDMGGINQHYTIFTSVNDQIKKLTGNKKGTNASNEPIRFTYVLYENQRRWIGIGWTASMLSYERSSWTDEFLNTAPPIEEFTLPEGDSGLEWKWIDKEWRLDLTNDGAIQLPSTKMKTSASPSADEGFIYYDNTWKKPTTEDSFSKYTRRRRWIRTAELIGGRINSRSNSVTVVNELKDTKSTGVGKTENLSTPDSISTTMRRKVSFSDVRKIRIINENDEEVEDLTEKENIRNNSVSPSKINDVSEMDKNREKLLEISNKKND
ncbi:peroxisome biogenesis protein [Nakaseomyces bracarensis]|uniref:peroxisome biogenesis protein n=1 Tax=Nakaseomyces bracarensis TaxID=273131 RepID=UPI003871E88C